LRGSISKKGRLIDMFDSRVDAVDSSFARCPRSRNPRSQEFWTGFSRRKILGAIALPRREFGHSALEAGIEHKLTQGIKPNPPATMHRRSFPLFPWVQIEFSGGI
jgi:hypothetical protein